MCRVRADFPLPDGPPIKTSCFDCAVLAAQVSRICNSRDLPNRFVGLKAIFPGQRWALGQRDPLPSSGIETPVLRFKDEAIIFEALLEGLSEHSLDMR